MKKFLLFLLGCLLMSSFCKAEYYSSICLEGTMGTSKVQFKLELCYDDTGLVWGHTKYHKKDGSVSTIQIYGTQTSRWTELNSPSHLYSYELNEYDQNYRICGHFSFSVKEDFSSLSLESNGKWFLNERKLKFDQVRILNENVSFPKPNADIMYKNGIVLNLVRKERHNIILIDNKETRIKLRRHCEFPYLLPSSCADSVLSYIKHKSDFYETIKYYEDTGVCIDHFDSLSVVSEGRNYITLYYIFWDEWSEMPRPETSSKYETFIKNNGSTLNKKDLFLDPSNEMLIKTIMKATEADLEYPSVGYWLENYSVAINGDSITVNDRFDRMCFDWSLHYSQVFDYLTPWAKTLFKNQHNKSILSEEEKK